jgi:hypothetical protein
MQGIDYPNEKINKRNRFASKFTTLKSTVENVVEIAHDFVSDKNQNGRWDGIDNIIDCLGLSHLQTHDTTKVEDVKVEEAKVEDVKVEDTKVVEVIDVIDDKEAKDTKVVEVIDDTNVVDNYHTVKEQSIELYQSIELKKKELIDLMQSVDSKVSLKKSLNTEKKKPSYMNPTALSEIKKNQK